MKTSNVISIILLALSPVPVYYLLKPYYEYWYDWNSEYMGSPIGIEIFPNESYVDIYPSLGLKSLHMEKTPVRLSCSNTRPGFDMEAETTEYEVSSSIGEDRHYHFKYLMLNTENKVRLSWEITSESTSGSDEFKVSFGDQTFQSGVKDHVVKEFVYVNPKLNQNKTLAFKSRHRVELSARLSVQAGFKFKLKVTVWKRKYRIPEKLNICKEGIYEPEPGTNAPQGLWFVLDNSNSPNNEVQLVGFDAIYDSVTKVYHALFSFLWNYTLFVFIVLLACTFPLWPLILLLYYCFGAKFYKPVKAEEDLESNMKQ